MRRATTRVAAQLTSCASHLIPPVHAIPVTRARSRSLSVWAIAEEGIGKRKATTLAARGARLARLERELAISLRGYGAATSPRLSRRRDTPQAPAVGGSLA